MVEPLSVSSKIPGSLMMMREVSHHESRGTIPTLCSIVLCIGQIIFALLLTLEVGVCGEGPYVLFWIELLSNTGILLTGVLTWFKVSTALAYYHGHFNEILTSVWKEFGMFVVLSTPSTIPSLSAFHTPIFNRTGGWSRDYADQ